MPTAGTAALRAGVRHVLAGERCVDPWKRWHELALDRYLARRTRADRHQQQRRARFLRPARAARRRNSWSSPTAIAPAGPAARRPRDHWLAELGLPADARLIGAINRLWPQKRIKDLIWAADLLKVRPRRHAPADHRRRARSAGGWSGSATSAGSRTTCTSWANATTCRGCCRTWTACGWAAATKASRTRSWRPWPPACRSSPRTSPAIATWSCPARRATSCRSATAPGLPAGPTSCSNDAALAQRLGAAGRQRMLAEFSVNQMVARHVELYEQVTQETPP